MINYKFCVYIGLLKEQAQYAISLLDDFMKNQGDKELEKTFGGNPAAQLDHYNYRNTNLSDLTSLKMLIELLEEPRRSHYQNLKNQYDYSSLEDVGALILVADRTDRSRNLEIIFNFIQHLVRNFNLNPVTFTWLTHGDVFEEAGGGAVCITANSIEQFRTRQWLEEQKASYKAEDQAQG